jgi:hypothetical protein
VDRLLPHVQAALPYVLLFKPQILDAMGFDERQFYEQYEIIMNYIEDVDAFCFRDPIDGALKWYDDDKYGVNDQLEEAYEEMFGSSSFSQMSKDREEYDKQALAAYASKPKKSKKAPAAAPAPAPAPAPKPKPKKSKKAPVPMPMEEYSSMYTPEITNQPPVGLGRKMCTCKH